MHSQCFSPQRYGPTNGLRAKNSLEKLIRKPLLSVFHHAAECLPRQDCRYGLQEITAGQGFLLHLASAAATQRGTPKSF